MTERGVSRAGWVSFGGALPIVQRETEALGKEGQPGGEEAGRPVAYCCALGYRSYLPREPRDAKQGPGHMDPGH